MKRVPRTYRLRADFVREIDRQAEERSVSRTRILEEALALYLSPTLYVPSPPEVIMAANGSTGSSRDADAAAEPAAG